MIAINPKILDVLKILSEFPAKAAMIAPTIMTDEMALVLFGYDIFISIWL